MQNSQLLTTSHAELEDNPGVAKLSLVPKTVIDMYI